MIEDSQKQIQEQINKRNPLLTLIDLEAKQIRYAVDKLKRHDYNI
jgi:hypothetical protein